MRHRKPSVQTRRGACLLCKCCIGAGLRNAAAAHVIQYLPGDEKFKIANEGTLSPAQKAGLAKIAEVMKQCKGTVSSRPSTRQSSSCST